MFVRACAAVVALAIPAGAAYSGGSQLVLSAVVAKSSRISVQGQPATIEVTAADVARGYVDLPAGPRLELWSNSRDGVLISLAAAEPFVFSSSLVVPRGTQRVELRHRLALAPAAQPGIYPWPLRVVATPL
jgi:hypothetical protein